MQPNMTPWHETWHEIFKLVPYTTPTVPLSPHDVKDKKTVLLFNWCKQVVEAPAAETAESFEDTKAQDEFEEAVVRTALAHMSLEEELKEAT
jgi:hypothetical protein